MRTLAYLPLFLFLPFFVFSQNCKLSVDSGYPNVNSPKCGENNGLIEIKASGNGTVMYKMNNGTFQESGLFENLGPGLYEITMKDDECEIPFTTILEVQTRVEIKDIIVKNSTCNLSDGTLTIVAEGENIQYSLDGKKYQNSPKFEGLKGGTYAVFVKDKKGCDDVEKAVVVLNGTINVKKITQKNTSCGQDLGEILVSATGYGKVQYRLEGVNDWSTTNSFTNLSKGSYKVQIKDDANCVITRTINITSGFPYKLSVKDADCGSDNGEIIAKVTSVGNYTYSIDGGGTYQSSGHYKNLAPGTYQIWMDDVVNGCRIKRTVVIKEDPKFKIKIEDIVATDCATNNGSVRVTADSEVKNFQIILKDEIISENESGEFKNLGSGQYIVKVFDKFDCELSSTFTISEKNDVDIKKITPTGTACKKNEGEVKINAISKVGASLSYILDGDRTSIIPFFDQLAPGEHIIKVVSEHGCELERKFLVPEYNPISITRIDTEPTSTDCSKDGVIQVWVNGTSLEYSLDGENYQQSPRFEGLPPGVYVVYVREKGGCEKRSGDILLPKILDFKGVEVENETCKSGNGTVLMDAVGRQIQYSIDGVNYQKEPKFENLSEGNYTAFVRDKDGCVLTKKFDVKNIGDPKILNIVPNRTRCGEDNGSVTFTSLSDSDTYSINGGQFQIERKFENLPAGVHTITVRDENGCENSFEFVIQDSEAIALELIINPTICDSKNGSIEIIATGGIGELEYSIETVEGLVNISVPFSSNSVFKNLDEGQYRISVRDSVGCIESEEVGISEDCYALFPKAFAPNYNRQNECYRIQFYRPVQMDLYQIFDRWGNKVFESKNFVSTELDKWWKGQDADIGTYMVFAEYTLDEKQRNYSGSFELLR